MIYAWFWDIQRNKERISSIYIYIKFTFYFAKKKQRNKTFSREKKCLTIKEKSLKNIIKFIPLYYFFFNSHSQLGINCWASQAGRIKVRMPSRTTNFENLKAPPTPPPCHHLSLPICLSRSAFYFIFWVARIQSRPKFIIKVLNLHRSPTLAPTATVAATALNEIVLVLCCILLGFILWVSWEKNWIFVLKMYAFKTVA